MFRTVRNRPVLPALFPLLALLAGVVLPLLPAPAGAQPGDADIDVEIEADADMPHHAPWYEQPVWVAILILGAVVLIVLIVMALRRGGTGGA